MTQVQGGTASNVIPAEARCEVDVRFFYQSEADRVDAAIRSLEPMLPGSTLEITGSINRPPMERNARMEATVAQARRIAEGIGMTLYEDSAGGASDGNFIAATGMPVLDGLGAHGAGMHAQHEHILIRSLTRRTALVAALMRDWQEF
ncbi:MAG: M20 family metallopeptidase [Anaerolineae bacterium]|nr:M20 family metallopeptidase [Anaerolineae bacterium]